MPGGGADYVPKPIDLDQLMAVLRSSSIRARLRANGRGRPGNGAATETLGRA
jgi:DNA-binding response OmpR family regulator